jgi:hypothetical protein
MEGGLRTVRLLLALLLWISLPSAALPQEPAREGGRLPAREVENWREDLRTMAREMPRRHRNLFHTVTREQFEAAVARLDSRIPLLAQHQIIVEMARIAAMVGDGHTNIAPTRDPKIGFRSYPVRLYLFRDGLYVRAASREHADLVGARVVKIGNAPWASVYESVEQIIGRDNEMGAKFFAPFLLAMPEVLHALGLIEEMERAEFTVESGGRRRAVVLEPAGPADLMAADTDTSWLPKPDWVDARDRAERPAPLWLKDPRNKFWFDYLPERRAVYVQFNQVGNKEEESIEVFAGRLFAFIQERPVERLVLDLRLNRGGNGALNRPLLRSIIGSKVDRKGRFFALIGRGTWSAAQMLVNELERYTNVTFVGEPTGGKPNHYGDSTRITLPNSGITVRVSTLWWQGDERDRRPWTAPRVAADLTFEDYRTNNDPALNAALSGMPGKSLSQALKEALPGGITGIFERYRKWKAEPANAYADTEVEVNSFGYELLAAGRPGLALAVFELNAADHPCSANAYDSLGEAYMARRDREQAIRSYEKALELDPRMFSAADALAKARHD